MSRIGRANDLIGKPVLTLDSARMVGEVKDVLIDPGDSRMIGFTLRGQGVFSASFKGALPAEDVAAIGRDAVMIGSGEAIVEERDRIDSLMSEQDDVIGKEAVSAGGASLGKISDVIVEIDGADAAVVGYEVAANNGNRVIVPVPESVSMSGDALVVPEDAESRAASGLASFRGALERTRS